METCEGQVEDYRGRVEVEEPKTQKVIKEPVASRRVMSGAMCCGTMRQTQRVPGGQS